MNIEILMKIIAIDITVGKWLRYYINMKKSKTANKKFKQNRKKI